MDGHVREGCFKLIRYPDWYKPKNKAGGQSSRQDRSTKNRDKIVATVEGSYYEEDNHLETSDATMKIDELSSMLNSLQQEVRKLTKGKAVLTASTKVSDRYHGSTSNQASWTSQVLLN